MNYDIKTIQLHHPNQVRERLVIQFHSQSKAILAEYLMTDAPLLDWKIFKDLQSVKKGHKNSVTTTGNRTTITMTQDTVLIEDALDHLLKEDEQLQSVTLNMKEFQQILQEWYEQYIVFNTK